MSERWGEKDLRELEHADEWDSEHPEWVPASKHPQFTVAITFTKEDFADVAGQAQRLGKRVTEFVREAALAQSREPMADTSTNKRAPHGPAGKGKSEV